MPASEYETVATVESMTKAGKFYTIKLDRRNGQLSCDCPAWIFQRGPMADRKACKHIVHLEKEQNRLSMKAVSLPADEAPFEGVDMKDCPTCGQPWIVHNGDGSCVQDEEPWLNGLSPEDRR